MRALQTTTTIRVTPIYGWGWVIGGKPRFETPEPFTLELEGCSSRDWMGFVLDDGYEFQGRRVTLSQRHVKWDGHVNILIDPFGPTDQPSAGFGMLAEPLVPSAGP